MARYRYESSDEEDAFAGKIVTGLFGRSWGSDALWKMGRRPNRNLVCDEFFGEYDVEEEDLA